MAANGFLESTATEAFYVLDNRKYWVRRVDDAELRVSVWRDGQGWMFVRDIHIAAGLDKGVFPHVADAVQRAATVHGR